MMIGAATDTPTYTPVQRGFNRPARNNEKTKISLPVLN